LPRFSLDRFTASLEAEIYPERKNENLPSLSPEQIRLLELFKKAYDEE